MSQQPTPPRSSRRHIALTPAPPENFEQEQAKYTAAKQTQPFYQPDPSIHEIGADEAGRGPLFGRVYSAAVALPRNSPTFDYAAMKDSKKFTSEKKIVAVAEHIKEHSLAWSVKFADEKHIDQVNILQATQHAMHEAIRDVCAQLNRRDKGIGLSPPCAVLLLIDGNYFNPLTVFVGGHFQALPYHMIEHGDAHYASIAAASILAKVERDKYVLEMCHAHPELEERYELSKNKGYGTKRHVDGIRMYGYSQWHRRSFHLKQLEVMPLQMGSAGAGISAGMSRDIRSVVLIDDDENDNEHK